MADAADAGSTKASADADGADVGNTGESADADAADMGSKGEHTDSDDTDTGDASPPSATSIDADTGSASDTTVGSIKNGDRDASSSGENLGQEDNNVPDALSTGDDADEIGIPPMFSEKPSQQEAISKSRPFFAQPLIAGICLMLIGLLLGLMLLLASKNAGGRFHRAYMVLPARIAFVLCAAVTAVFGILFLIVFFLT
jgi:hypothetical protein